MLHGNWHAVPATHCLKDRLIAVPATQVSSNAQRESRATNTISATANAPAGMGASAANAAAAGRAMRSRLRLLVAGLVITSTTRLINGCSLSSMVSGLVANFCLPY